MDPQTKQARVVTRGTNDQPQISLFRVRVRRPSSLGKTAMLGKRRKRGLVAGWMGSVTMAVRGSTIRRLERPSWGQILLEK